MPPRDFLKIYNLFIAFLQEKGVYDDFIRNYIHSDWNNVDIYRYFKRIPHYKWILEAFDWIRTPQGSNFWSNLQYEWKTMLDNPEKMRVPDNKLV